MKKKTIIFVLSCVALSLVPTLLAFGQEKELELKQKAFGKLGEDRDQAQERFAKLDPIQRRQALDGLSKSQEIYKFVSDYFLSVNN